MSPRHIRAAVGPVAIAALVAGGLVTATGSASAAPVDTEFCAGQSMVPVTDLVEGQPVNGLSTVKGTAPSPFTGSYVGKLDGALGNDTDGNPQDILLFELSSPEIDGHDRTLPAGIWAGMSGSPVYDADGALIGAVSYSFSTEADNVAGVTPAAYMKKITPTTSAPPTIALSKAQRADVAAALDAPAPASGRRISPAKVVAGAPADRANTAAAKSPTLRRHAQTKKSGFRSGSAGLTAAQDYPIEAGGNIATTFSYGDVTTAAVGTVTAVCGDQVFAFGHPDEYSGKSVETFHGASAVRIVPSGGNSYKLANIGTVKGVINQDRTAGIQGTLGQEPVVVPIDTTTTTPSHPASDPLLGHTDVSVPFALPFVTYLQVAKDVQDALAQHSSGDALVTWTFDYTRENGDTETYRRAQRVSTANSFPEVAGFEVASDLESLVDNGFEKITVTRVRVTTNLLPDHRAYKLAGTQYRTGSAWKDIANGGSIVARPGATVRLRLKLKATAGSNVAPTTVERAWKMSTSARGTGSLRYTGQAFDPSFFEEDLGFDDDGPDSFDGLVELLQSTPRQDSAVGELRYRGARNRPGYNVRTGRTPGIVSGSTSVRVLFRK